MIDCLIGVFVFFFQTKVVMGQEIAVVEAMKMQNVLRAERDAVVESVVVVPGSNVGVDEVLVTFAKDSQPKQ